MVSGFTSSLVVSSPAFGNQALSGDATLGLDRSVLYIKVKVLQ